MWRERERVIGKHFLYPKNKNKNKNIKYKIKSNLKALLFYFIFLCGVQLQGSAFMAVEDRKIRHAANRKSKKPRNDWKIIFDKQ